MSMRGAESRNIQQFDNAQTILLFGTKKSTFKYRLDYTFGLLSLQGQLKE